MAEATNELVKTPEFMYNNRQQQTTTYNNIQQQTTTELKHMNPPMKMFINHQISLSVSVCVSVSSIVCNEPFPAPLWSAYKLEQFDSMNALVVYYSILRLIEDTRHNCNNTKNCLCDSRRINHDCERLATTIGRNNCCRQSHNKQPLVTLASLWLMASYGAVVYNSNSVCVWWLLWPVVLGSSGGIISGA